MKKRKTSREYHKAYVTDWHSVVCPKKPLALRAGKRPKKSPYIEQKRPNIYTTKFVLPNFVRWKVPPPVFGVGFCGVGCPSLVLQLPGGPAERRLIADSDGEEPCGQNQRRNKDRQLGLLWEHSVRLGFLGIGCVRICDGNEKQSQKGS